MILTLLENERSAIDAKGGRWWKATDGRWRRHGQVEIVLGRRPPCEPETRYVLVERGARA